jgi:hypothetical protein
VQGIGTALHEEIPYDAQGQHSPRRFSITMCRARRSYRGSGSGTCIRRRRRPNTA